MFGSVKKLLAGTLVSVLFVGVAYAVTGSQPPADAHCVEVSELGVWVCGTTTTSTTTSTTSSTTSTTSPSTTTTTPSTTTTTIVPPFQADQCVLNTIKIDKFDRSGNPKSKFDIEVSLTQGGGFLWVAPYLHNLGNGYGWISGDRAGYAGAYMFLVDIEGENKGLVVARVLFHNANPDDLDPSTDQYVRINDSKMWEIQQTNLGYGGMCTSGDPNHPTDPQRQFQVPSGTTEYGPAGSFDEVRPLIPIIVDGVVVEDRSYTNTVKKQGGFVFQDGGLTTVPFTDFNGVGGTPHTVYERQIVLVVQDLPVDGPTITGFVYYDILDPVASFGS